MSERQAGLRLRKGQGDAAATASSAEPWLVLVVDDDQDMQHVTRLLLAGMEFEGRPLELLPARSCHEAKAILLERREVALALVDVVMESDDAGLRLVRHIRQEMGNPYTRIVLRTGQPGQAPEDAVIRDYDINDYREKTELTSRKLVAVVLTALRGYRDIQELRVLRDRFDALAHQDGLTGIPNRRSFDETLAREWRRCLRTQVPLALILGDVDLFKRYNDRFGHKAGDEVLRQVAQTLAGRMRRPADLAARYGGEEFACILPDTDAIRTAVYELAIPNPDSSVLPRVTVSCGVAAMQPRENDNAQQLLELADTRLYLAKRAGRNQVVASAKPASLSESAATRQSGQVSPLALAVEAQGIAERLTPARQDLNRCLELLVEVLKK
jgi:diguanylate cyclase (GGDEF)-like protein